MNRRELIELVTAAGLTGASAAAFAADAPPAGGHDLHDMAGMHGMHEHAAAGTRYPTLAAAASKCVATGEACLAHCIALLAGGDTTMKDCAATTQDVISACTALQQMAVRNAPRLAELAAVCGRICRDCESECKKHEMHAVCRDCRDSCAECARECERLAA